MVRLTALLIDDDPVSHFINTKVLRHIGVENIHAVLNGKEALDHVMDEQAKLIPDVIFVDLNMPVMDGFGFITEFKKLSHLNHKMKLVILTSSYDPTEKKRAMELGVTNFLTKPASEKDFREILEPLVA